MVTSDDDKVPDDEVLLLPDDVVLVLELLPLDKDVKPSMRFIAVTVVPATIPTILAAVPNTYFLEVKINEAMFIMAILKINIFKPSK